MEKPVVSLVRFSDPYHSLKEALELCDGLREFKSSDRILIKPNIVGWDFDLPFPPFGVIATTTVMANLVRLLKENGLDHLTIGESVAPDIRRRDRPVYAAIGYDRLATKYGVTLVDFHRDRFLPVDFGDFKLSIAETALEADRIINVPVLKTHNQATVSLGVKNLKGCLDRKSRMLCHGTDSMDLMQVIPRIIERLPVGLTIIDGVYALAKGPGPSGRAYRKNVLVASRDTLACDLVGAAVIGYRGEDIGHLGNLARRTGRSCNLADVEVKGERLEDVRSLVDYDWEWTGDDAMPVGFRKRGITGVTVRKYDNTMCTGCSAMFNPLLILLMAAARGGPFDNIEVVNGKCQKARPGFKKTILFGRCACDFNKDNPHINHAVPIRYCPPDILTMAEILRGEGMDCSYEDYAAYRRAIFGRYRESGDFDLGHWTFS